jgi:hypothetical protein
MTKYVRTTPARQLRYMLWEMRKVRVEELDHRDWHSLLRVFGTLVVALEPLAQNGVDKRRLREALYHAVEIGRKNKMPVTIPVEQDTFDEGYELHTAPEVPLKTSDRKPDSDSPPIRRRSTNEH